MTPTQQAVPDEHPGYTTVHDIAVLFDLSPAQIYRLAARYRWRRYWLDGHIRYHRGDVLNTMATITEDR